ncbi:MAG: phosphoglucomutase [Oscillochloridaceae bacterium]|nr:phosphoglucomutase [Chloroflexaceae bacterium]MDW8389440.1 phosphoglucomutase [Oscillochloridaceae bacterium]
MSVRYRPYAQVWAAVVAADFTLDQVRRRGVGLARQLVERGLSCLVAYDTRFMGGLFARDLVALLQTHGVRASLAAAPVPLPAVYHALDQRVADTALCVSAGNQSYYINGLMLLADTAGLSLEPVDAAPPATVFPPTVEPPVEQIVDVRKVYLKALRDAVEIDLIRRTSLTIFVDAMNGPGAGIFPALLGENGQTRAIEINREPDPLFARVPPTPVEHNLSRLKKLVRESDSHLGLAISADGTAMALVDKHGEQLDPAETGMLLAAYLARQHRQRGTVIIPAPAAGTPLAGPANLTAWEDATGLKIEIAADPEAHLAKLLTRDRTAPVLVVTADGQFTLGRYARYPDGILAGLLCAEMVARSSGNLRELIDAQRKQLLQT